MNNIHHVWITTKIPLGLSVTLNLALMLSKFQISYSDLLIMHEMQVQRQKVSMMSNGEAYKNYPTLSCL